MRQIFADTGFWIAVIDPADPLHDKARRISTSLYGSLIVTSQLVLIELLNALARRELLRRRGALFARRLQMNANVEIVPLSSDQFAAALQRYEQRVDKQWSLTDCASFLTMEQRGITDALAYDQHFRQAGYTALLRDD